ncbi:MAG: NADH-quinone oxidoreductase subunit N [Terriglobales bacterium]
MTPASHGLVPAVYYLRILPEIVLTVFGAIIMLLEAPARHVGRGRITRWVALAGALAACAAVWVQSQHPGYAFGHLFRVDGFTVFFGYLLGAIAVVIILMAMDYLPRQDLDHGEFYALILFGTVGMAFMAGATELILMFIALEISSISTYILAGYRRHAPKSTEASLKYLLLGSFATAFFLYGIALIYGATGTTQIAAIAQALAHPHANAAVEAGQVVLLGAALMFIGLGFKVSAVPFQVWTPDVYEGAPAPVTAFLAAAPKAAAFAIFLRIFTVALASSSHAWSWMFWLAALLSMTVGNVAALLQNNFKRMLAYSSIAQAGYILVAFAALGADGVSAVMFYLAAYAAMNIGAFLVVSHFAHREERYVDIRNYAGLGYRSPWPACCLAIFLFSLIGIPLTGGFFGKVYIFRAALHSHLIALTVIGVLNSALAAYYYLRPVVFMYMHEAAPAPLLAAGVPAGNIDPALPATPMSGACAAALALCVAAVIWLGVFPNGVLEFALRSASHLLRG